MINFPAINAAAMAVLESLLCEWFPAGKRIGSEFCVGGLDGHAGTSLQIHLRKGQWMDFATGEKGGDPVSLLAAIRRIGQCEAARELAQRLNLGVGDRTAERGVKRRSAPVDEWVATPHAPKDATPPRVKHWEYGRANATWTYRTAEGLIAGVICRFNLPDGGKDILPMCWCRHTSGRSEWRWKQMAKPRPLYNLRDIIRRPSARVLVVEGEKTCEAAKRLVPSMVCTTWAGGAKAIEHTDWDALYTRHGFIWPDNDEAGLSAARAIQKKTGLRIIQPPTDRAQGWDLADAEAEGWTTKQVMGYLK